jgi:hypothetical protein
LETKESLESNTSKLALYLKKDIPHSNTLFKLFRKKNMVWWYPVIEDLAVSKNALRKNR